MRSISLLVTVLTLFFTTIRLEANSVKLNKAIEKAFSVSEKQYREQDAELPIALQYPRTLNAKGELVKTKLNDWTEGFFPGALWYIYENNKQEVWKQRALKWTLPMEKLQFLTSHHDIGFLMFCSYGNAYKHTKDEKYKQILIQSAKSLCTRFSEKTGCIKSWNYRESWDGKHKWFYPVIIDNMMNLELLYFATEVTGDKYYADIATKHAETTLKNHFRADYSSYHVVNYDPITGDVLFKGTCQGFADNSTWARGQAWAIYGYTMTYRFTKDEKFLKLAQNLADYWIDNPTLPKDFIPYWDFNAPQKEYVAADWIKKKENPYPIPRDASAAAITCSALFELSGYVQNKEKYYAAAVNILRGLTSSSYLSKVGQNGHFALQHSVGSIPHGAEIDVPLVYADYYFLEAMNRYKNIKFKNFIDFVLPHNIR